MLVTAPHEAPAIPSAHLGDVSPSVRRFAINSSLSDPVDSFEVELANVSFFTTPNPLRRLRLSVGLLDPANAEYLIGQLRQGEIFDMRLAGDAASRQLTVRGLDAAAALVRGWINKQYLLRHPEPGAPPLIPTLAPTGVGPYIAPLPEVSFGVFRASQIAQELATRAGLTLAWGCRDYTMREDFAATGRLIDVLARLIEPWCLVDAVRVDVYVRGRTLIVQERSRTPAPTYTHTVAASRVTNLTIDRAQESILGDLLLFGKSLASSPQHITTSYTGWTSWRRSVNRTVSKSGRLTSIIEVDETYRMPDGLLLASDKRTYVPSYLSGGDNAFTVVKLASREIMTADFESSLYGPGGPINQPLRRNQTTETYAMRAVSPSQRAMVMTARQTVDFSYDATRFLRSVATLTEKLDRASKSLRPAEEKVVSYQDAAWGQVDQVTSTYRFSKKQEPTLVDQQTQYNAGSRVGGSRPPSGVPTSVEAQLSPIWEHRILSTEGDAVDLQYANPHLDAADLTYLRERLTAASGLYRYTISFTGPVMPWLRKGIYLLLTGYTGPNGEPITLAPALVTDVRITFDAERPGSTAEVAAVFWRST